MRPLLFIVALVLLLSACSKPDRMCPAEPMLQSWEPYKAVLPANTVICGGSATRRQNPPTDVYELRAYFRGSSQKDAASKVVDAYFAAGWEPTKDGKTDPEDGHDYLPLFLNFWKPGTCIRSRVSILRDDNGTKGDFEIERQVTCGGR
jgi:hypothetical protein